MRHIRASIWVYPNRAEGQAQTPIAVSVDAASTAEREFRSWDIPADWRRDWKRLVLLTPVIGGSV